MRLVFQTKDSFKVFPRTESLLVPEIGNEILIQDVVYKVVGKRIEYAETTLRARLQVKEIIITLEELK